MRHADLAEVRHSSVWAVIAKPDRGAVGNAAIADVGGKTLVIDTHISPAAARELRTVAGELRGRTVSRVVNTHWHGDHVLGNVEFGGVQIVSTRRTRELIASLGAQRLEAQRVAMEKELPSELDQLRSAGDEEGAELLAAYAQELQTLQHRLPDETFEESYDFGGAEALTFGGGHLSPGRKSSTDCSSSTGSGACPDTVPVSGREVVPPLRDYLLALAEAVDAGDRAEAPERVRNWAQPEMWERNVEALRRNASSRSG